MVSHGRVELLAHPLSQKYLQMKWNAYGKYFHVTNLLIYTVFLSFVTLYASQLMGSVDNISVVSDGVQALSLNASTEVSSHIYNIRFVCYIQFHLFYLSINSRKHRDWFIQNPTIFIIEWKITQHTILSTNKST